MKIYVGAGPDGPMFSAEGWTCNDTADAAKMYSGISLVSDCWALSVPDGVADEVLAKGMLEHLTYREVVRSLIEWRRVLKPGGHLTVEVPDADEYIREYLAMKLTPASPHGETRAVEVRYGEGYDAGAEGEPDDREVCTGPDRWLRRALWGWQRWPGDEHRSGWTEPLLAHYLRRCFSERFDVRRMAYSYEEDAPGNQRIRHLWARAWKTEATPPGMDLAWLPESARVRKEEG